MNKTYLTYTCHPFCSTSNLFPRAL